LLENDRVAIVTETLAEIVLDNVRAVSANDGARSSFTVRAGHSLIAVDQDLAVLGRWPVDPRHRAQHATSPDRGLALISGADEVLLLDHAGRARWRYPHPQWTGAFESGCAWFDEAGQPHAVVPAGSYDHCLVLCLDLDSGRPLAQAPIEARPAGIIPVHHPDGWVGLSEGEGQDAARAWWVRSASEPSGQVRIEVLHANWDNWVLSDVDPSGTTILTTPHVAGGPLLVRSFPGLETVRSVDPPAGDEFWDFTAFFAGHMIVNALLRREERLVAIDRHGRIDDLDEHEGGWHVPAAHGTWLTATRTTIRRRRIVGSDRREIVGSDEEIPGQMRLW
jgi:hypothetical protein